MNRERSELGEGVSASLRVFEADIVDVETYQGGAVLHVGEGASVHRLRIDESDARLSRQLSLLEFKHRLLFLTRRTKMIFDVIVHIPNNF